MLFDKFQYLSGDVRMATNVTTINFPVAQLFHLCILGWHDTNGDLRRLAQVRAVERNRRNRPTSQPLARFLAQALEESIFHHIAHLATVSFTIGPFDPPGCRESSPLRMQFPGQKLAIDGQIKKGEVTYSSLYQQSSSDRPNLLWPQGRSCPY